MGVAQISESRWALDFLMKLDPKRFTEMLNQMKNDAPRKKPEAYSSTLAGACRIASGWSRGIPAQVAPATKDAAYVTDTALVATVKEPEKPVKKTGGTKKKNILTETICHVCGLIGHYARNCIERKSQVDKVHITSSREEGGEVDTNGCDYDVALVATSELCFFSHYDVLLDNEASLNIFINLKLLTGLRRAEKSVSVGGIQLGGAVTVNEKGDCGELGKVFYSPGASANILSFAAQVDAGAAIRYDYMKDSFSLKPRDSARVYHFSRKNIPGSAGRFYCCDWRKVLAEAVMVTTAMGNSEAFTKREIERGKKARELLARMGFPTVQQAMSILNSGSNFEVTARDFQIADAIWGTNIASIKRKTIKRATTSADITVNAKIVQQDQVLAIDIMYIDKTATLIGLATPLGLTIAYSLYNLDLNKASRAAHNVKKGIIHFMNTLSSQNLKPL